MPVMDGLEATRIIRKMERPDAVQIPIFGNDSQCFLPDDRKRCKEAGNDGTSSKTTKFRENDRKAAALL